MLPFEEWRKLFDLKTILHRKHSVVDTEIPSIKFRQIKLREGNSQRTPCESLSFSRKRFDRLQFRLIGLYLN